MQAGLLDTHHRPDRTRGGAAWALSLGLVLFYLLLYLPGSGFASSFPDVITPISNALHLPSKWFLYGLVYTLAMVVGGSAMLKKHGNSNYHRVRTLTLVGVQIVLAFSLPLALNLCQQPELYFSYVWPLDYDVLFPKNLAEMPLAAAIYFVVASLVAFPWLAWRYGKRFYCSWICGCGGLAETFGDPWRHLSDKSSRAWTLERWSIYSVLALVILLTVLVFGAAFEPELAPASQHAKGIYGFFVGAIFSGVLGVGLYPLMGTRVWCRFGCPMAALLGLIQKFGRFRIEVKRDMCIACGNCSTYCEMGIDVRAYAMANMEIRRASCVGCGMCAHVCPRGVLRLTSEGEKGEPAEWVIEL